MTKTAARRTACAKALGIVVGLLAGVLASVNDPAVGVAAAQPTVALVAGGAGVGPALGVAMVPAGITVSGTTMYVADPGTIGESSGWGSHGVVRAIDLMTGSATVVAGTGVPGSSGDAGPAVAARLTYPVSVGVDGGGRLDVLDVGTGTIRRVAAAPAGAATITTVASGLELPLPASLTALPMVVDSTGNAYFIELPDLVRKVDPSGVVTTVAGGGTGGDGGPATSASLDSPAGIAVDTDGTLYISQSSSQRIRRVDATGTITTFVSTAASPGPLAIGSQGIYSVVGNNLVRFARGGASTVLASFADVQAAMTPLPGFSPGPDGLAVDASGNVYVSSRYGLGVVRVGTNGQIRRIAGSGAPDFSGDGRAAITAQLGSPRGVAAIGNAVYIADGANQRVRRVDTATGTISTVAGNGTGGFAGDGAAAATSSQLWYPQGLAADRAGNLYVADVANSRVRRIDPSGVITTVAGNGNLTASGDGGPATRAGIGVPADVSVDLAGNLYIADERNSQVRRVDRSGVITTVAGTVAGFGGDGGPATSARLSSPTGLASDMAGDLFIADFGNNRVRRVDTSGTIATVAGTGAPAFGGDGGPALAAGFSGPTDVVVDGFGTLFVADAGNARIRRVDTNGTVTTAVGDGVADATGDGGPATSARVGVPVGLALTPGGALVWADTYTGRVRQADGVAGPPPDVVAARFVSAVYRDVLGRSPTAAEVDAAIAHVGDATNRLSFAASLTNSDEFRRLAVSATYAADLGRAPSAVELTALTGALAAGWTLELASSVVLGSDESYARVGANPGGYVDALYRVVLGRAADGARSFWVAQVTNGVPRWQVALAFFVTREAQERLVEASYTRLLGRPADAAGLSAWADALGHGMRDELLVAGLVASDEYLRRA